MTIKSVSPAGPRVRLQIRNQLCQKATKATDHMILYANYMLQSHFSYKQLSYFSYLI